jgi:hypothetical protein
MTVHREAYNWRTNQWMTSGDLEVRLSTSTNLFSDGQFVWASGVTCERGMILKVVLERDIEVD